MSTPQNPFGLTVDPEPPEKLPGSIPHHAEVTIEPQGFIPAHFHEAGPDGEFDHSNAEIYVWQRGGTLRVLRRRPDAKEWEVISLNERNPVVAIPAGWHHGAVVTGRVAVVFRALSRADHFRSPEQGGNVHRLPDKEQPEHIKSMMFVQQMSQKT